MLPTERELGSTIKIAAVALFFAIVLALTLFNESFAMVVHGIIKSIYGGTSLGKTIFVLGWFIANAVISAALIHFRIFDRIRVPVKIVLVVFIAAVSIGLFAGQLQFLGYMQTYDSAGPFISYVNTAEYQGVEWAELQHNHFPKAAFYFLVSSLGIENSKSFDDGFPMFVVSENAAESSMFYLTIILIVVIAGFIFANKMLAEHGLKKYILFLAAELGFIVLILDGGMYSTEITVILFLMLLFLERTYFKFENPALSALFPAIGVAFYTFIFGHLSFEGLIYADGWGIVVVVTAVLVFLRCWKCIAQKKPSLGLFMALLAVFLLVQGTNEFVGGINGNMFGENIIDDSGIYIYGLPENFSEPALANIASGYGQIKSIESLGWGAYIRLVPEQNFRLKLLENDLRSHFQPMTYLVASYNYPVKRNIAMKFVWLGSVELPDLSGMQGMELMGLRITDVLADPSENSYTFYTEGETNADIQLLTVFTLLREQGYNENIIGMRI